MNKQKVVVFLLGAAIALFAVWLTKPRPPEPLLRDPTMQPFAEAVQEYLQRESMPLVLISFDMLSNEGDSACGLVTLRRAGQVPSDAPWEFQFLMEDDQWVVVEMRQPLNASEPVAPDASAETPE